MNRFKVIAIFIITTLLASLAFVSGAVPKPPTPSTYKLVIKSFPVKVSNYTSNGAANLEKHVLFIDRSKKKALISYEDVNGTFSVLNLIVHPLTNNAFAYHVKEASTSISCEAYHLKDFESTIDEFDMLKLSSKRAKYISDTVITGENGTLESGFKFNLQEFFGKITYFTTKTGIPVRYRYEIIQNTPRDYTVTSFSTTVDDSSLKLPYDGVCKLTNRDFLTDIKSFYNEKRFLFFF